MSKAQDRRKVGLSLQPGERVLVGAPGVSMPGHWFVATVLWTDGAEVLTEHGDTTGTVLYRQVLRIEDVRAVGDYVQLMTFQDRCRDEVKDLRGHVNECEAALGAARDAVWKKLDEIAASGTVRFTPAPRSADRTDASKG